MFFSIFPLDIWKALVIFLTFQLLYLIHFSLKHRFGQRCSTLQFTQKVFSVLLITSCQTFYNPLDPGGTSERNGAGVEF